jgi:hypothetical protein
MTGLSFRDSQAVIPPVDVVQSHGGHFTSPKAIGGKQQQDRVVALAGGGTTIHALQHTLHLIPTDGTRNTGKTEGLRRLNDPTEILGEYTLSVEITKKDA